MLLTVGYREHPIAMPSLLEELIGHLKICGSQTNFQRFHDVFDLQDRFLCQCVIIMDLIPDDS
jgi:hypothetical protein